MYFRWQSIPELADLPKENRKALWEEARRDPFRASDLLLLLVLAVGVAVIAIGLTSLPRSLPV